jgi:FtsP/CotA-like multicopper oxidase with cupredoxin domain
MTHIRSFSFFLFSSFEPRTMSKMKVGALALIISSIPAQAAVDVVCTLFPVPVIVPSDECCSLITSWIAGTPICAIERICSANELNSDNVSCSQIAQGIYVNTPAQFRTFSEPICVPEPICEMTVHIMDNGACLEAVVAFQDVDNYELGSCASIEFTTPTGNTFDIDFYQFTEWSPSGPSIHHSLDLPGYAGQCAETSSVFLGSTPGSCSEQGYHRPAEPEQVEVDGTVFELYDVGIEGELSVYIHKVGHNSDGKCSQIKVLASLASLFPDFSPNMCSREGYIVPAGQATVTEGPGIPNTYTLSELPGQPKTVSYSFSLRQWTTDWLKPTVETPGDGYRRSGIKLEAEKRKSALLLNGQYPGPLVEAVEGDTISVNVSNHVLFGEITSIHWHGLHMRGTPWADGAYMVSQGPLLPLETQNYEFKADPAGTFFYHSHLPMQRARGVQGPLIIHKRTDPCRSEYDEDRIIYLTDELKDPNIVCEDEDGNFPFATGPGSRTESVCGIYGPPTSVNGHVGDGSERYPYHLVPIESGVCYRLRFVYAHSYSAYGKISIAGHTFKVISIDGQDIVPIEVDSFNLHQGGRLDILLCANQAPGMYGITVLDELACGWVALGLASACTYHAFLSYDTFDGPAPKTPPSIFPGPIPGTGGGRLASTVKNGLDLPLDDQESLTQQASSLADTSVNINPEQSITLNWGVLSKAHPYEGPTTLLAESYRWYIDEKGRTPRTFRLPEVPLLQSKGQCGLNPEDTPIINIPEGITDVEVIVNNLTPFSHALHIHGMSVKIVNIGHYLWTDNNTQFFLKWNDVNNPCENSGGYVQSGDDLDKELALGVMWGCSYNATNQGHSNNYANPLERDTLNLPRRSWVVLRFKFDNPGVWPFHCHISDHALGGSMILFNVLPSQIPERPQTTPTQGLDKCKPECSTLDADTCNSFGGCAWQKQQGCLDFNGCGSNLNSDLCVGFANCKWQGRDIGCVAETTFAEVLEGDVSDGQNCAKGNIVQIFAFYVGFYLWNNY